MHSDHGAFEQAVKQSRKVRVAFLSRDTGTTIEKLLGPLVYNPSVSEGNPADYYFWDLDKESGKRVLRVPSSKIVYMELAQETFYADKVRRP